MFDWLQSLLTYLPWVGGAGVAGYAALWFFFPSFIPVIAEYLKALAPFVGAVANGLVEYVKALWEGLLDMLDNAKSVIFVVTVIALSAVGGYQIAWYKHNDIMAELRRDYAFVKRKGPPPRAPAVKPATVNPFDYVKGIF